MNKTKFSIIILIVIFTIIGIIVAIIREDIKYTGLFASIGLLCGGMEYIVSKKPELRQVLRLSLLFVISGILFGFLSLYKAVNFQFPQIVFDASSAIIAGALIQLVIARLILPFFFGNGFCSRACWDGFVFEMIDKKISNGRRGKDRSEVMAWSYLAGLIIIALAASKYSNPAEDEILRRMWIVGENVWILSIGIILTPIWGSRAYCRMLCPFKTISGIFSKYSIYKITPVRKENCTECGICNKTCPMHVNILSSVRNGIRINQKSCILCERCVYACPSKCLQAAPGIPWA